MSQCEQILEYLKKGNTITPLEALDRFGCFRLASRINDLKNQGHCIGMEMRLNLKTGKRYAEYFLLEG